MVMRMSGLKKLRAMFEGIICVLVGFDMLLMSVIMLLSLSGEKGCRLEKLRAMFEGITVFSLDLIC